MNRLKQLRTEKNITQDVLAKLLCMEVAGYSKLETERVPLKDEYILKLADFFDVSTDYLLGKSEFRKVHQSELPEIRRIERGAKKMSKKDREKMVNMVMAAFEEAFNEDDENT